MAASEVNSDHAINLNYGTHHNRDERKSERNVACHWSCLRQPQHQNQTYRSLMKGSFLSQSFSTVAGEFFLYFQKAGQLGLKMWESRSVVIESVDSFKFTSLKVAIISLLRFLRYYVNIINKCKH